MDLFEMDRVITELECANEKVRITVSDLNNTYFGDVNPQKDFLKYYYDMAHTKISIALDYINEMDLILKNLKEIVDEET